MITLRKNQALKSGLVGHESGGMKLPLFAKSDLWHPIYINRGLVR